MLDRTTTIRASVPMSSSRWGSPSCLVVMVILLFLRNFWATFIPGVTVPLALLGSFAAMYLLDFSLDNLSLMALTISMGFVVDDAIVVVENIYRHIEDGETPFEAALKGSREIGFTVLSISFSLIAVFIPLLLMGGIIGRLFREFALTVTASIAVSALVSLTLAPMMCSRFMQHNWHEHGRSTVRSKAASMPCWRSIGARSTSCCVTRRSRSAFPCHDGDDRLDAWSISPRAFSRSRTSASSTASPRGAGDLAGKDDAAAGAMATCIQRDPDMRGSARSRLNSGAKTANTGSFYIVLKPRDEREHDASQIIDRLRPQLAKVVGATLFLQPSQDIKVGGRLAPRRFQYTLQDATSPS